MKTKYYLSLALLIATQGLSAQWSSATSGTTQDLNTIWRNSGDVVIAGGNNGTLLRSTDGGVTYASVFAGFVDDINEIQFLDDLNGYAVADNGRFLSTNNGGLSWTVSFLPTGSNLAGLYFQDMMNGHVVGRDGVIFTTSNGGGSWTSQSSGVFERLESVWFTSSTRGFVAGRNDTYLETSNGGSTWTASSLLGTGRDLNDVMFVDASNGFIASDNGVLLRTTDGGSTWTSAFIGTIQNLNEVHFLDQNEGYVAGDFGTIMKSIDGGASFAAEVSGTTSNLEDIHFSAPGLGASAGDFGAITVLNASTACASAPDGLAASIGVSDVTLSWNAIADIEGYQVQGAAVGSAPVKRTSLINSYTIPLSSLAAGDYQWRVRARCTGGIESPYSSIELFTIASPRKAITAVDIQLYPNPASELLHVEFGSAANLDIYDLHGVLRYSANSVESAQIDVSDWPAGVYIVHSAVGTDLQQEMIQIHH
jgi:photosystem II stability/assembly factor-like uncharacterized protein